MTPLEELQAAHGRLSEMRNRGTRGEWHPVGHRTDGRVGDAERLLAGGEGQPIGDWLGAEDADLIVTLHRTIFAQLALLTEAVDLWNAPEELQMFGHPMTTAALDLARAINHQEEGNHD